MIFVLMEMIKRRVGLVVYIRSMSWTRSILLFCGLHQESKGSKGIYSFFYYIYIYIFLCTYFLFCYIYTLVIVVSNI